ncbi:hypothetical protein M0R45_002311 [Rubus argutus]|uniref:Uncharacterized protein n=1 Tax=Rubus argutus TaxID=59490 RepID=A0AAW1VJS1_RUBAR
MMAGRLWSCRLHLQEMATAEKVMVTRRRRGLEAGIQGGGLGSLRAGLCDAVERETGDGLQGRGRGVRLQGEDVGLHRGIEETVLLWASDVGDGNGEDSSNLALRRRAESPVCGRFVIGLGFVVMERGGKGSRMVTGMVIAIV